MATTFLLPTLQSHTPLTRAVPFFLPRPPYTAAELVEIAKAEAVDGDLNRVRCVEYETV